MIRFSLSEKQFLALCAGRTIRVDGAEFHLRNIGWHQIINAANDAMRGDEKIPCDSGCGSGPGHRGPCR